MVLDGIATGWLTERDLREADRGRMESAGTNGMQLVRFSIPSNRADSC